MFVMQLIGHSGKFFFGHPVDIDKVALERGERLDGTISLCD